MVVTALLFKINFNMCRCLDLADLMSRLAATASDSCKMVVGVS